MYCQAASLASDLNRQDLVRELAERFRPELDPADYPTWRTVFRALFRLARDGPLVIILDELQYLLTGGDDITSQLVATREEVAKQTPITLMLSGSAVSAMEHLHAGGAPLYGRVTWAERLAPFDYWNAAHMAPWLTGRDRAYLYGVFGGMPRYLAAVREDESLQDAVTRVFLVPQGEVHLQMDTLIEREKGIRQPADYRSLLSAVATGRTLVNAIVMLTGLEEHVVRRGLEVLAGLELIRDERSFGAGGRAAFRYRVADNAVAFWHHFIVPHRSRLATEAPTAFWRTQVRPWLDTYMGRPFEVQVRQAYTRFHERWGLPSVREWARWEGADRNGASLEIDIAARLDDGRLLVGEVKWSAAPFGPALHTALLAKLARLAASGQGWANDTDDACFLYVSAAGFAPGMVALAQADPRLRLLALDDLY